MWCISQEVLVTVSLVVYDSGSFGYSVSNDVYLRKFWLQCLWWCMSQEVLVAVSLVVYISGSFGYSVSGGV